MNNKRKLAGVAVCAVLGLGACGQRTSSDSERVASTTSALSTGRMFALYPFYFQSDGNHPSWSADYGVDLLTFHKGPADFVSNLAACRDVDYYHYCENLGLEISLSPDASDTFADYRWGQQQLMKARGWQRFFAETNRIGGFFSNSPVKLSTVHTTLSRLQNDKDHWAEQANQYSAFIGGSRTDAYANIRASITRAAEATRSPLVIRLAQTKATVAELSALVARFRTRLDEAWSTYSDLLQRFVAYKATEAATGASIRALAVRASTEDVTALAKTRNDLFLLSKSDTEAQGNLAVDALRLDAVYRAIKTDYEAQMAPYAAFLSRETLTRFASMNLSNHAKEISVYCGNRERNRNEAIAKVYDGVRKRSGALIAMTASDAARRDLARARLLEASRKFLDDVTAQSTAAWTLPPQVGTQNFPLLAGKYDAMTAFISMAPLCAPNASAPAIEWMGAGCAALNRDIGRARIYVSASLPAVLRFDGPRLQAAGTAPAVVQTMISQLTAGDLRGAVLTHDSAALLSEGGAL